MTDIALRLLNISLSASVLITIVLLLRFALNRAPKRAICLLWLMVGLRLALPFSIESPVSLAPKSDTINEQVLLSPEPVIDSGYEVIDTVVNPVFRDTFTPEPAAPVNPLQIGTWLFGALWLLGLCAMLLWAAVSYLRLRLKLRTAVLLKDDVYESDRVCSPFLLGFFRPRIYLPFGLDEGTRAHVVAHERTHKRRWDHLTKSLAFLLLTVYWFNPLVWVAYILFCRDMELACDEAVVRNMEPAARKSYAEALLLCAVKRTTLFKVCPIAFGEVSIRQRVKKTLSYKKPLVPLLIAAIVACAALVVFFLTDPMSDDASVSHDPPFARLSTFQAGLSELENDGLILLGENNTADKTVYLADTFRLEYWSGNRWVNCAKNGSAESVTDGAELLPGAHTYCGYDLFDHDMSRHGTYRLVTAFNDTGDEKDNVEAIVEFEWNGAAQDSTTTTLATVGERSVTFKQVPCVYFSNSFASNSGDRDISFYLSPEYAEALDIDVSKFPYLNLDAFGTTDIRHIPLLRIDSVKELPQLRSYYKTVDSWQAIVDTYDKAFFKNHSLFFLTFTESNENATHKITQITKNGKSLSFSVLQNIAGEDGEGFMHHGLLAEVRKDDVKGCTQFDARLENVIRTVPQTEESPVKISLTNEISNDSKTFTVRWSNTSDTETIYFGEAIQIEYLDGDLWVPCVSSGFSSVGYILSPLGSKELTYRTASFDLSRTGTYRMVCEYSTEESRKNKKEVMTTFQIGTQIDSPTTPNIPIVEPAGDAFVAFGVQQPKDFPIITIILVNKSDTGNVYYDGYYRVECREGDKWIDCTPKDFAYDNTLHVINKRDTFQKEYSLSAFQLVPGKTYRVVIHYSEISAEDGWVEEASPTFGVARRSESDVPQYTALSATLITANSQSKTVRYYYYRRGTGYNNKQLQRFDSPEELETLRQLNPHEPAWEELLTQYDASFFATKTLLFLSFNESSGSTQHKIDHIEINGNTLNVLVNRYKAEVGTADVSPCGILIELDRADLEKCTELNFQIQ